MEAAMETKNMDIYGHDDAREEPHGATRRRFARG
jgi:hypothetical protein